MNILLIFATEAESSVIPGVSGMESRGNKYTIGEHEINVLVTGVGGIFTAWSMKHWLSCNPAPDLAINAGIAGSFTERFKVGDVVVPVTDCFADLGLERDGMFVTLEEAGLIDPDGFPFKHGLLKAENRHVDKALKFLPGAKAVTVNTASGSGDSINRLLNKFNPEIETMEGATFFYICSVERIPFLAVRAISNKIEPGNRSSWDVPMALNGLANRLNELFLMPD